MNIMNWSDLETWLTHTRFWVITWKYWAVNSYPPLVVGLRSK
jgi:hypothetical protein